MFVTSRKFGVIGSLCVGQSGDKNSRKCCRWRLRYIDSDLLLHVEKLHGAWLGRTGAASICSHFREMLFWRFQAFAWSRRGSKFLHIPCISGATWWLLLRALWAAASTLLSPWNITRSNIAPSAAALHTRCQISHCIVRDTPGFLRDKGGRERDFY